MTIDFSLYIHICTCIYLCSSPLPKYLCTYIYIYVYAHADIHMYIYIYTHTYLAVSAGQVDVRANTAVLSLQLERALAKGLRASSSDAGFSRRIPNIAVVAYTSSIPQSDIGLLRPICYYSSLWAVALCFLEGRL